MDTKSDDLPAEMCCAMDEQQKFIFYSNVISWQVVSFAISKFVV